jgi:hypothetical protein
LKPIRTFVTDVVDRTVAPRPAVPAIDSRPRTVPIHVFNHLPQRKPAAPKRVNVDGLTTTLASIAKVVRAKQPKRPAADAAPRQDNTSQRLAEMNATARKFWLDSH